MKSENQLFFNRLGQLPLVKAARVRVEHVYEVTKNSNPLINSTLQMAENSVKYVSEVDAVKLVLNSQLVTVANTIAVNQLDKIEQKYPIVGKTPSEVWDTGKNYYEQTRVKKTINKFYSAKNFGVATINTTKKYAAETLNTLLDYSDQAVDKYVVVHNEANGEIQHCEADHSYFNRVRCISGKFYHGMKYRTKQIALQLLALDMQLILLLAESAKNTAVWTFEKTQTVLTTAQEQTVVIWHGIQNRVVEPITETSENIVLRLVQISASNFAAVSQLVADSTSPYLPEGVEKTVMASAAYANELRDNFAKAETLGDLRDEVIAETKEKLSKGIDYLAEFPLISWLIPARFLSDRLVIVTTTKTIKVENGHVEKYEEENKYQENGIYEHEQETESD